jgi:DNA helicase-2/ATP-dependent DNA helicase PcrA
LATTTRPSTAGAARKSRTCSISCATSPATTIKLEQNYRSTANILQAANAVIANNPDRLGKRLWTDAGEGEAIDLYAAYNESGRGALRGRAHRPLGARWRQRARTPPSSIAAMRSRAPSKRRCCRLRCPYRVYGGMRFFERAEIKDTLAYLRLIANRADDAAFERAVNTPTRGIGERTLDRGAATRARHGRTACGMPCCWKSRKARSRGARRTRWPASSS